MIYLSLVNDNGEKLTSGTSAPLYGFIRWMQYSACSGGNSRLSSSPRIYGWKIGYLTYKVRTLSLTLSPANTLNDSITCSAVSLSVVSLVMNSINDLNVTCPVPVGSTIAKIRWNSASPLKQ